MDVGTALRELREAAGLKQRELAASIGVTASMLSLVEAGKREPTISFLRRVATALGIPASVLFAVALAPEEVRSRDPVARRAIALAEELYQAAILTLKVRPREAEKPKALSAPRRSA